MAKCKGCGAETMKKVLVIITAYAIGVLTSALALEKMGAHITWFAPWTHNDQKYVLKEDYIALLRRYFDLRRDLALIEEEEQHGQM